MARPIVSPSVDTILIVVALILAILAVAGIVSATIAFGVAIILICIALLT
jgi:hypothetical protein